MIQLEDKLYTSTEVADILGVSLRSVYRYLEENKLDAEVKTATGRHRFSKKNIIDFLYPNGSQSPAPVMKEEPALAKDVSEKPKKKAVKKAVEVEEEVEIKVEPQKIEEEKVTEEITQEVAEEQPEIEEPVDWLAKFREAAKKYREEAESTQHPEVSAKAESESAMSMADTMSSSREPAFTQNIAEPKKDRMQKHYYRSSLGGLKDIAQNIDRGSRNSYLDYAFTLSAGLSLYKPIKPFSMLHAYVRSGDQAFFEKLLGLTPTDEANSQLCLLLSEEGSIYKAKEELHGLFVVSKERLLADIQTMGDSALVAEASGILK